MRRLFFEVPMTEAEAARWATSAELAEAAHFVAPRRREWLAWRAVVRRELGRDIQIAYNDLGAPILLNSEVFLSVAHCKGGVAVCFSDRVCGVDIEPADRNFLRAAPRYLSLEEQQLSSNTLLPAVVWCAKEVLYKLAGRQELDFLRDLHIDQLDLERGTLVGRIADGVPLDLVLLVEEGFVVVCRL